MTMDSVEVTNEAVPQIVVGSSQMAPPPMAGINASVLPAAPAVAIPAALVSVQATLERVADALRTWEKRLVSLRWRDRTNNENAGGLDITLSEIRRSSDQASTLVLKFTCKPLRGEAVVLSVRVEPYREGVAKYHIRFIQDRTYRDWICTQQNNDGEWVISDRLAKPKGIPVVEQVAEIWFSNGASTRAEIAPRVEKTSDTSIDPRLAPWWPQYDPNTREWTLGRAPGGGIAERATDPDEWAGAICACALWGTIMQSLVPAGEPRDIDKLLTAKAAGLPSPDLYVSRRAVDLKPGTVQKRLDEKGLRIPWHVVEAACAALNSGKHVIFTGPPGCGKSKFAGILSQLATGRDAMLVTASPAWSSGDLVGRYFPARSGQGLEFRPGFFLQAVDAGNRWLVVDDFNRANIDECFGELFSVLAGDVVDLPFDEEIENSATEDGRSRFGRVRIVPEGSYQAAGEGGGAEAQTVDYPVGASFRIIGTMNDADRAMLHKLSFALLRRFQIIRVEAPPARVVANIVDTEIERVTDELKLDERAYAIRRLSGQKKRLEVRAVRDLLCQLFARDDDRRRTPQKGGRDAQNGKREAYSDLVRERVVGLATVLDVIRFVAEGIRAPNDDTTVIIDEKNGGDADGADQGKAINVKEHAVATSASFLAMAVALSVFPQLDGLTSEARMRAVRHILSVFDDEKMLMRRMEEELPTVSAADALASDAAVKSQKSKKDARAELRLKFVEHTDPSDFDFDGDRYVSLGEYLVEELCQQYRGTPEALEYRALLQAAPATDFKGG